MEKKLIGLDEARARVCALREKLGKTQMTASRDIGISLFSLRTLEQGGGVGAIVLEKVELWLDRNGG